MNILVTGKLWKDFLPELTEAERTAQEGDHRWGIEDDKKFRFDISELCDESLHKLLKFLDKKADGNRSITLSRGQVRQWMEIKTNPAGSRVTKLENLPSALKSYLEKTAPHRILFCLMGDGNYVPYFVREVDYHSTREDIPARVSVSLSYIDPSLDNESHRSETVWLYHPDISGKTIDQILSDKGWFVETPERMASYEKEMEKFVSLRGKDGLQLNAVGKGNYRGGWRGHDFQSCEQDGRPCKVVIDSPENACSRTTTEAPYWDVLKREESDEKEPKVWQIPFHPYVRVFDLERHDHLGVHVNNVSVYEYDTKVGDKLVLPADVKDLLEVLVEHANVVFSDIVAGKAGGAIVLCQGAPGTGKAQPLTSIVQTIDGPRIMGSIKVGDLVMTPDGSSSPVLGIYPQGNRPVYEITFADGRKVRADEDHLWKVKGDKFKDKRLGRKFAWDIVTTKRLYSTCFTAKGLVKVAVPLTCPVGYANATLPIAPWLLGFLIGDGAVGHKQVHFSTADKELVQKVTGLLPDGSGLSVKYNQKYDYRISRGNVGGFENSLLTVFRDLRLHGCEAHEKFVPAVYMRCGPEQRLELVRGLMDSDGTADKSGNVSFSSVSFTLAQQMQELIWGLGGVARITTKKPFYTYKGQRKIGRDCYNVRIRHPSPSSLFTLARKAERCRNYQYAETLALDIVNIEYVGEEPTQCILVDNPSHLYLTDGFVVTHNTLTAEVYSEVMKRPLYKVQASQLGTSVDHLEDKLQTVLGRAEKWGAILLLDEADVYVHERGNDIEQNAIVGVFLRVLEYYRGVLFMTTNRATEIDDAIVSRLTARITYAAPDADDRRKIWQILAIQNNIMLPEMEIDKLVKDLSDTTGRDIKNLLKLANLVAAKSDGKVTAELIKRLRKFKQ